MEQYENSLKKNTDYEAQQEALVENIISVNRKLRKAEDDNQELELLYREDSGLIGELRERIEEKDR